MYAGETRRAPSPTVVVAAPLQVFLLGRFEVVRGDGPVQAHAWRRRRPADLLKRMALAPGRSLARERVIEDLWPDRGLTSGANNLHRALYDLRQILGGRWVDLDHGRVFLSDEVWLDVDAFERSAASDDPAERSFATALYRGDLCPDDQEAPWLADRRRRLRDLMMQTALPLAREAATRDDAGVAVPMLRQVLAIAPHAEEAHALVMRLLAEAGRRVDALRQYDACEAALRAAGLPPPAQSLRTLREDIQGGRVGPSHPPAAFDGYRRAARRLLGTADPAPLRGRTSCTLVLESLVERGSGTLVLLGERGVGTSRLAIEGARIAQDAGAVVVNGTFEAGRRGPYSCFADLFLEHARANGGGRDPFADVPADGAGPQARRLEAARAELAAIGGGRPVYLIIEDLHLTDESSANLFHFLARAAQATGLMLVATCREDALHAGTPAQMLLSHLDCERLARGIRVQRLDLASSRALLADVIGADPGEALAVRFYRLTDGSPFYLEELARAFKESGHVEVPEDPSAAVRERVARLGRRAVTLLEAGAVMGRRFELGVVLPATGLSARDSLAALEEVLEARIVDDDGTELRFHQSLVRDALYEGLEPGRRAALHRAIADSIEERAGQAPLGMDQAAEQLAHHRRAGGQPDRAFLQFVTAGHSAAERGGLREACAFYQSALAIAEASNVSGPQRLVLLEGLGQAQLALAEIPGALRTLEASSSLSDPSGWRPGPELRARTSRLAALGLLVSGRSTDARGYLDRGLVDAQHGTGDERAEILHLTALLDWYEGRRREIPDPASSSDEPSCEIHLALWQDQLVRDRSSVELEHAAAAFREHAVRRGWQPGIGLSRAIEGTLAARGGRFEVAELALREARALSGRDGCTFAEAFTLERLSSLLTVRGRVEEALGLAGEGLLLAERARLRRHALLGMLAALARNRLAAGALYAAEDALAEASTVAARHGECAVCLSLFLPEMVRVHLARGRLDQAGAEVTSLEDFAAASGSRSLGATAAVARGRVLLAQGRVDEAAARFVESAMSWTPLGNLVDAARSQALAARAIRSSGAPGREPEAAALAEAAARVLGITTISDS